MKTQAATTRVSQGGANASEQLFERYLQSQGITFEYEPTVSGKKKRPDYHLRCSSEIVICDVKTLRATSPLPAGGTFHDPYRGIREEIDDARKQFKEYCDHPCVLLIHNIDDWEFRDWPWVLFGAMLGNLGMRFPFNPQTGTVQTQDGQSVFLRGGRMIHPHCRQPRNTTFSAVGVLSEITVPDPEFEQEYERRIAAFRNERRGEPPMEECLRIRTGLHHQQIRCTRGVQPRVAVFENPFARIPLPGDLFSGRYDSRSRFDRSLGRIERVFAGEGLLEVERLTQGSGDLLQKLEQYKQALVERFEPRRIVLFGSHAYGCPEPGSDIDLLVEFPGSGSAVDRSLEIRRAVPTDLPVDLLTRTEGEIAQRLSLNDPFFQEIRQRGQVLYESAGS